MRPPEYLGPYRYCQSEDCFPLSGDTLLLAEFATVRRGWRVCDLGCGAGALSLLLLAREPELSVTGIELRQDDARLARRNLENNGLSGEIYVGDLRKVRGLLPAGRFELVASNPPYFSVGSGKSGGPARMEEACTLDDVCAAAAYLTKNGGRFVLVYRPERLADLLRVLRANALEPKRLQLVQHRADKPPFALLLEAVRRGAPGLEVLPTKLIKGDSF